MSNMEQFFTEIRGFASATSNAVAALTELRKRDGGQETIDSRTLQKPEVWRPKDAEEEMSGWPEWSFLFKAFMAVLDSDYENDLETLERQLGSERAFDDYLVEEKTRAKRLYSYLVSYLKGRPLRIVRAVANNDGFKAWQQLCKEFQPQTRQRTLCLLQAITQYPAFEKGRTLEGLLALEKLVDDYEKLSGEKLSSDLKTATLLRCCPGTLRQHLELTMSKDTTYGAMREALTNYEQTTTNWSATKMLKQLQTGAGKDDPMEVDRLEKGGKGKYGKGGKSKGKGKDGKGGKKGKGKAKSNNSWSSGKGDQHSGKVQAKGDGKSKGAKESRECFVCGKVGHLAKSCWNNDKKVRQVEEAREDGSTSLSRTTQSSSSSTTSSSPSTSSTTYRSPGMVRRVTCAIKKLVTPPEMRPCEIFDMSEGIEEEEESAEAVEGFHYIAAVVEEDTYVEQPMAKEFHAILDLGADVSVVPQNFLEYGEMVDDQYQALLRDCQGNFIKNSGRLRLTMLVRTEDEEVIGLTETFVIANVKQPLIAVGKWLKKSWRLEKQDYTNEHLLSNGHRRVPLVWKGNALAFNFQAKALEVNYLVKLNKELEEIAREKGDWIMEDGTPVTVNHNATGFQESEIDFVRKECPYRTTLVLNPEGEWHCLEDAAHKDVWRQGAFGGEVRVPTVTITIFHRHAVQPQGGGAELPMAQDDPALQGGASLDDLVPEQGQREAGLRDEEADRGAEDEEIGASERPRVEGALADEVGSTYVIVNGKRIEESSTLAQMREACVFLGIGKSGGKQLLFGRLRSHARLGHSRMAAEVVHKEENVGRREPVQGPPVPQQPGAEARQRHRLTHLPFEEWCEECVATRSRDSERHERREAPLVTVALDYMHTSTTAGHQPESEMIKHLVGVDSWTKALLCVPIPGKGGISLKRCVTAVTAFARDHDEMILKGDGEPSMKQLIEAVKSARTTLKMKTEVEYTPPGDHQANPAERAIQTVRRLGNTLLEAVNKGLNKALPGTHALRTWAYAHAAWLYNRFHVLPGSKQTPFEVATERPYKGRLTEFGTAVFGQPLPHKPQQRKGLPGWVKGVFVGKLVDCDLSILSGANGLFLSRGVRRCAEQWQQELVDVAKALPWEEKETPGPKPGKKRQEKERAAMLEEVVQAYRGDEEAQAVALFARLRASEALQASQRQAVDGVEDKSSVTSGPREDLQLELQAHEEAGFEDMADLETEAGSAGAAAAADVAMGDLSQPAEGAQQAVNKRSDKQGDLQEETEPRKSLKMLEAEEPPTKTLRRPTLVLPGVLPGGATTSTTSAAATSSSSRTLSSSPTFAGNLRSMTKVILDEGTEVEVDEEMIPQPGQWGDLEEVDFAEWERTEDQGPPNLGPEELAKLDAEAEDREEERLIKMGVLLPEDEHHFIDESYRKLTTKQVKDWRFREGQWLRRSRLVARDYRFLSPELEGLFSPASNGLSTKLWAAVVQSAQGQLELYSADVKDAYLMVKQEEKVYVVTRRGVNYILGRNLPGQRTGSKNWYNLLAEVLTKKGLTTYKANPSIFFKADVGNGQLPLVVSTHVDDLQIMGSRVEVNDLLQHLRDQNWELQVEGPCGPHLSGQCSFLKRKFVSDGHGHLWVKLNDKYISKLVEELHLGNNKGKSVPTTGQFQKGHQFKPLTEEQSRAYRTCVGVLLYMASERADIQCATRALAAKVTCPDDGDWKELKQVVLYLKDTADYVQKMSATAAMSSSLRAMMNSQEPDSEGVSSCSGPSLLEVYSDSNWAGDRQTRRSVSCAMFFVNGNYFFGVTRSQRSIALSSGEAEFVAAVSALADAIYLRRLLERVLGHKVFLELRMDSSAARSILQRHGVQRTRHIATGLLWVQERVSEREAAVKPVAGQVNPADIGTKGHSQARLQFLLGLLGYQTELGGADLGHRPGQVQRLQRLQRQLVPWVLAALRTTSPMDTEELFVRSISADEVEDEMREEVEESEGRDDQQAPIEGSPESFSQDQAGSCAEEPEPESQNGSTDREPESDLEEPSPYGIFVWMTRRLLARIRNSPFGLTAKEALQRNEKDKGRLEVLREMWHQWRFGLLEDDEVNRFFAMSDDLSSDGEVEFRVEEVTEGEAVEELDHLGVWADQQPMEEGTLVISGDLPRDQLRDFAAGLASDQGVDYEERDFARNSGARGSREEVSDRECSEEREEESPMHEESEE